MRANCSSPPQITGSHSLGRINSGAVGPEATEDLLPQFHHPTIALKTNMTRLHGRCPRGQRLTAKVPHGPRKTLTFVAGLRRDGFTAPCVFDGPIDGESFLAWVEQFLAPTLRLGDIVVMDNLSSHKDPANPAGHPIGRCQAVLSAALQPGSEPDRAGVFQAEDAATQRKCPQARGGRTLDQRAVVQLDTNRMPQLFRCRRHVNLKLPCSNITMTAICLSYLQGVVDAMIVGQTPKVRVSWGGGYAFRRVCEPPNCGILQHGSSVSIRSSGITRLPALLLCPSRAPLFAEA